MTTRLRSRITFLVLFSLGLPILAAGCGSKPAPAPGHSVKNTAKKAQLQGKVQNAVGSAKKAPTTRITPETITPKVAPVGNATDGAKLYTSTCESCHGKGGTGTGKAPRLASPSSVVAQFKTQGALEAFVLHNMPANNPGSLSPQKAANVSAYVWHLSGGK